MNWRTKMIINPKRILWPTDFSPLSLKAADYANGFRDIFDAELHVIHVCQPLVNPSLNIPVTSGVDLGVTAADLVGAANAQLKRLCGEQFRGDKGVKYEALVGNAWQEVCAYANRAGVDLIIVATHGRTGLKHVLLGSVAERIVQHASCPVLVVKSVERDFTAS
jgi:nucleotide-binding universal stress UspA family protein